MAKKKPAVEAFMPSLNGFFFINLQDYCTSQLKFVPCNFIRHCPIFTMSQNTRYAFIVAIENRCKKSFFRTRQTNAQSFDRINDKLLFPWVPSTICCVQKRRNRLHKYIATTKCEILVAFKSIRLRTKSTKRTGKGTRRPTCIIRRPNLLLILLIFFLTR